MHVRPWPFVLTPLLACGGSQESASPPPTEAPQPHAEHAQAAPHGEPHGGEHGEHHGGHHGHHGGPLVHRFEKAEDWAKEFDDPARDAWQKPAEVVALMKIAPGMTVADIGAGTGYFEPHLSRAVGASGKVLALDVEADMVRYLGERIGREKLANVEARKAEFADPGLAPGSVDRVLVVDTWHHIDERPAYVGKLQKALKPGGLVVIVDFTLEAQHGPPKEHRIAPEKVAEELKAGGLTTQIATETLPDQYVVIGARGAT